MVPKRKASFLAHRHCQAIETSIQKNSVTIWNRLWANSWGACSRQITHSLTSPSKFASSVSGLGVMDEITRSLRSKLYLRIVELRCQTSYHQLNDFKTSLALAASYRLACPSDSTPCRWQRKALGVGTGEWDAAKGMWASPLTVPLVVSKSSVLVISVADSKNIQKFHWSSFVFASIYFWIVLAYSISWVSRKC